MEGTAWAIEFERRITAAFRDAPFTERGDGSFRIDTDARFKTARENLNWAVALLESLHELEELVAGEDPKGEVITAKGYRASSVNVGHVLWAAVTAVGVLDRIAAGFGALHLTSLGPERLYDFRKLWEDLRPRHSEAIRSWMRHVRATRAYSNLEQLRDPMAHRTMLRRITVSVPGPGIAGSTSGNAGVSRQYGHPDQFVLASGASISCAGLLEQTIPFLHRQLDEALTLFESGEGWP